MTLAEETLVLIPSQLCTAALWREQVAVLEGIAPVYIPDLTAHDSIAAMARQIGAEASGPLTLMGFGMGGFVAFELWRQSADRIRRMALIDTLAGADTAAESERRRGYSELVRQGNFAGIIEERIPILLHETRRDDQDLVAHVRAMAEDTGPEAFIRNQAAIIARIDSGPTLSTIDCPALVVRGADDKISRPEHFAQMTGAMPQAEAHVVAASGHMTLLERPREMALLLKNWLQQKAEFWL